ncbi:MAG: ATP-binding protein [Luteolibacter sp.]
MSSEVKETTFKSEGRLLQELGERLVASPEVALTELIKNAFDADAQICSVTRDQDGKSITIADNGNGMTEAEFLNKWMKIGTSSKRDTRLSSRFERPVTGEKGIGRFAVRFLGSRLKLETVSEIGKKGTLSKLTANFDWKKIDSASDLGKAIVTYRISRPTLFEFKGTKLTIEDLRFGSGELNSAKIKSGVLEMVSPLVGLDSNRFRSRLGQALGNDPGFSVIFNDEEDDALYSQNLSQEVLDNWAGKVTVNLTKNKLVIKAEIKGWAQEFEISNSNFVHDVKSGFVADIRYFPKRKGMFSGKGVNGTVAWGWIKENSGISIVDRGLRIRPYGMGDNDWLWQDTDSAASARNWRSPLMLEHFGNPASDPKTNPVLYLPKKRQVVGAVFVESESEGSKGLVSSSGREGFQNNKAFATIQMLTRTALELLALADKSNQERIEKILADEKAKKAKASFEAAIRRINASSTLSKADKERIVSEYTALSTDLDEAKDYAKRLALNLNSMSLLGVVAGYMTHESKRIIHSLKIALRSIRQTQESVPGLEKTGDAIKGSLDQFCGYIDYTTAFVDSMHAGATASRFKVKPQLVELINKFNDVAASRGVQISITAESGLVSPSLPVAAYTGIVLNLFTNAVKAVLADGAGSPPRIEIRAWNEKRAHVIQVLDNGVGIPDDVIDRVWDPLFTTTSGSFNPMGSGMGLGLSLVKNVIDNLKGKINIVDPPPGFTTCFEVSLPS